MIWNGCSLFNFFWICVTNSLSPDILIVSKFVATMNNAGVSVLIHETYDSIWVFP